MAILPPELQAQLQEWQAVITTNELESAVTLRASQWAAAIVELVQRLESDWDKLVSCLGLDPDAVLAGVSPPKGDLHNFGRSVYQIEFEGGTSLIYKPRPVDAEMTFGKVVGWLRDSGCLPVLQPCRVVQLERYGWMAYVASTPCRSAEEAERFYERQGGFLALFYLLNGGDCLHENFIGCGEHPVWVDTECVCFPTFLDSGEVNRAPQWLSDSVLTTLMVYQPNQMKIPPRHFTGLSVSCLENRAMVFAEGDVLKDRYIAAVLRGLDAVYRWILAHRDHWTADSGPLSWWYNCRTRVVLRGTMTYAELVKLLMAAPSQERAWASKAAREVLESSFPPVVWRGLQVEAEMASLHRGDIPYSTATTSSLAFETSNCQIEGGLAASGMDALADRAAQMSVGDLQQQLWLTDAFLRVSHNRRNSSHFNE